MATFQVSRECGCSVIDTIYWGLRVVRGTRHQSEHHKAGATIYPTGGAEKQYRPDHLRCRAGCAKLDVQN